MQNTKQKKVRAMLKAMDSKVRSLRAKAGRGNTAAQDQLRSLLALGLIKRTKFS